MDPDRWVRDPASSWQLGNSTCMWTETVYVPVGVSGHDYRLQLRLGLTPRLHALLGPNVLGDQNAFTKSFACFC